MDEFKELKVIKGEAKDIWSICYSPDGEMVAFGANSNVVKIWKVKEEREIATLKGHTNIVESLCFSCNSAYLASASDDGTCLLWKMK